MEVVRLSLVDVRLILLVIVHLQYVEIDVDSLLGCNLIQR